MKEIRCSLATMLTVAATLLLAWLAAAQGPTGSTSSEPSRPEGQPLERLASAPTVSRAAESTPALLRVAFDDEGNFVNRATLAAVLDEIRRRPPTHLFLLAHGWNNSYSEAHASYTRMLELLTEVADKERLTAPGYRPLFVGLHWPSKAWDRSGPAPEGGRDSAAEENALIAAIKENFPPSLSPRTYSADVLRFRELLGKQGGVTEEEQKEARALMRRYSLPPAGPEETSLLDQVQAGLPSAEGDSNPIWTAFRAFTFWQMKKRAGVVGQRGVHELLKEIQQTLAGLGTASGSAPLDTRICLVGHSFGAKLVLAAVADRGAALPRPVHALVLLQGALSHEAFADKVTGAPYPGAYRDALTPERVQGPVLATYSKDDVPLNRIYPAGSFLGGPLGEGPSRYSALGAVGAYNAQVRFGQEVKMKSVQDGRYDFSGRLWSVTADAYIRGHSDLYNKETAWLILAAGLAPGSTGPETEGRRTPHAVVRYDSVRENQWRITVELKNLSAAQLSDVPEPVRDFGTEAVTGVYRLFPRLGGAGTLHEVGRPELPVVVATPRRIPAGAQLTVTVLEAESSAEVWPNVKIAPARLPWSEKPGAARPPRSFDRTVYSADEFFPGRLAKVGPGVAFRETSSRCVYFYPVQYNPVDNQVRVYKKLVALLDVKAPQVEGPARRGPAYSSVFAPSYTKLIDEYRPPDTQPPPPDAPPVHYLAFVPDELADTLEPLLKAKRDRNLKVKSVKLSELQDGRDLAKRRELIKLRVVQEARSSPDLAYLLLVGDAATIPPFKPGDHPAGGDMATDLYYATLSPSGGQYIPDLAVGRLPARNAEDLKVMVDKILRYEKALNEDKKGSILVAAEHENSSYQKRDGNVITSTNRWFLQTADSIRNFLATNGQQVHSFYVASDNQLPKPWFYFDTVTRVPDLSFLEQAKAVAGIMDSWDKVRLVFHRDHGLPMGWAAPPFGLPEVRRLRKPEIPPVVFSINCESGYFDQDQGAVCFAEELLRQPNGASGVIAASRISYSGYNDRLAEGLMMGLWPAYELGFNPAAPRLDAPQEPRLGVLLNTAKLHVEKEYPQDEFSRLTAELFHCFGDPEMRVLTSTLAAPQRPETVPPPTADQRPVIKFKSSFPEGYK